MEQKRHKSKSGANEKLQLRFEQWISGDNIPFENTAAKARYQERATLIKSAVLKNKIPQRVPACPTPGTFLVEYGGISFHDAMYNPSSLSDALKKYHRDFDPDTYSAPHASPGRILELLDSKQYRWPGHGVPLNQEIQYYETEHMKAEEYDQLINDLTGFHLSVYLPRICGTLEPLKKIPPIVDLRNLTAILNATYPFSLPEVQMALAKMMEAGAEAARWSNVLQEVSNTIMGKGYPMLAGGITGAPFDIIGDFLRGTRGIALDMKRCPEKLLQACERYVYPAIRQAVDGTRIGGSPMVFIPLHKGSHSFMSKAQFREFYWPTLRKVVLGLIDEGLVPMLFAEGDYESRLEIISDLPANKTIWWFEQMDMAKAKTTIGQVACIAGNVPNILFRKGTPDDMRLHCQRLIDDAGKGGGYILSTAAGMQGAKPENVKAMFDTCRTYGIYN